MISKALSFYIFRKNENINWPRFRTCWLASKNLPINFFDDKLTQKLFTSLNPEVKMPKRNSMREEIMEEFPKMENNIINILQENDSRYSFPVDACTMRNGRSYYGITIHFIDKNFQTHAIALDLAPSYAKHTGKHIAELFYSTLKRCNIHHRIQGITVDNAAATTKFMEELSIILKQEKICFDEKDQHFRCFAHILNLSVQNSLKLIKVDIDPDKPFEITNDGSVGEEDGGELDNSESIEEDELESQEDDLFLSESLKKLRSLLMKIHFSEKMDVHLQLYSRSLDEIHLKIVLDVKTRWNSTYAMITNAFRMKKGLTKFCETYPGMINYKLEETEWNFLEGIQKSLGYFKHVSDIVSTENECTLPVAVIAFNMLLDKIEQMISELDKKVDRNKNDEEFLLAIQEGRDKILKHYRKCNWIYCVSLILDPRHKLTIFDLTDWGRDMKNKSKKKFEQIYRRDYIELDNTQENSKHSPKAVDDSFDINFLFDEEETNLDPWTREIDKFLKAFREPRNTNILDWWKKNQHVYPTLSKFARDILGTQASSVSVERMFSECNNAMTDKRGSLKNDVFKAFVLIHSWMKSKLRVGICEMAID